jgi:hypothetical protein
MIRKRVLSPVHPRHRRCFEQLDNEARYRPEWQFKSPTGQTEEFPSRQKALVVDTHSLPLRSTRPSARSALSPTRSSMQRMPCANAGSTAYARLAYSSEDDCRRHGPLGQVWYRARNGHPPSGRRISGRARFDAVLALCIEFARQHGSHKAIEERIKDVRGLPKRRMPGPFDDIGAVIPQAREGQPAQIV